MSAATFTLESGGRVRRSRRRGGIWRSLLRDAAQFVPRPLPPMNEVEKAIAATLAQSKHRDRFLASARRGRKGTERARWIKLVEEAAR